MATHWPHGSPPGQNRVTPEGSLGLMVSPVREEASARTFGSSEYCRTLSRRPQVLPYDNHWGISEELNHWASARERESLGLTVTSSQTLVVYLLAVSHNQRFQPTALSIFRAELLPIWPRNSFGSHSQFRSQSMDHSSWSPFCHLPGQRSKFSSPTKLLNFSFYSHPFRKPSQRTWAASDPLLQLHSGREPNQQLAQQQSIGCDHT